MNNNFKKKQPSFKDKIKSCQNYSNKAKFKMK